MFERLLLIFGYTLFISLTAFSGSAQALFYDFSVQRTHWLSPHDFAAYLGFGFATPGPQVVSIATFIGYSAGGFSGALVGTLAIYATPCLLAILSGRYLGKLIHHERADYFIQAIGLTSAGLLTAIGITILRVNPVSYMYLFIATGSFLAVVKWKVNPLFIITIGGLLGIFFLK